MDDKNIKGIDNPLKASVEKRIVSCDDTNHIRYLYQTSVLLFLWSRVPTSFSVVKESLLKGLQYLSWISHTLQCVHGMIQYVVSIHYSISVLCCKQHKEDHSFHHYLSMKWSNVSFQYIISFHSYVANNTRKIILATVICPWNDPMCRFNTLFYFVFMLQTTQGRSFLLPLFVHEMIQCVVSIHYFISFLCYKQHKEN